MAFRLLEGIGRELENTPQRTVWVEYWAEIKTETTWTDTTWTNAALPVQGEAITIANGFSAIITNAFVQSVKILPVTTAGEVMVAVTCQILK